MDISPAIYFIYKGTADDSIRFQIDPLKENWNYSCTWEHLKGIKDWDKWSLRSETVSTLKKEVPNLFNDWYILPNDTNNVTFKPRAGANPMKINENSESILKIISTAPTIMSHDFTQTMVNPGTGLPYGLAMPPGYDFKPLTTTTGPIPFLDSVKDVKIIKENTMTRPLTKEEAKLRRLEVQTKATLDQVGRVLGATASAIEEGKPSFIYIGRLELAPETLSALKEVFPFVKLTPREFLDKSNNTEVMVEFLD